METYCFLARNCPAHSFYGHGIREKDDHENKTACLILQSPSHTPEGWHSRSTRLRQRIQTILPDEPVTDLVPQNRHPCHGHGLTAQNAESNHSLIESLYARQGPKHLKQDSR